MVRSRYRSQPHLDRGGRAGRTRIVVGLFFVAALGGAAFVFVDRPATLGSSARLQLAVTPSPKVISNDPAPPVLRGPVEAPTFSDGAPSSPKMRDEERHGRSAPSVAVTNGRRSEGQAPRTARIDTVSARAEWERQLRDYGRAVRAYYAQERVAGQAWASQHKVKAPAQCEVTRRRTTAFMEGCMGYVQASEKSRERRNKRLGRAALVAAGALVGLPLL